MNLKKIAPFLILVVLAAVVVVYYRLRLADPIGEILFSGTIEATETNLPTVSGGIVKNVYAAQGDSIQQGQDLADIYSQTANINETISSPIDGKVLERLVEPGEFAAPGSTVMVVASLETLTLTIYVPEDRYGQISLGQTYPVTVDSFPGQTFRGSVRYISDKAEFTPRNVQTKDSRQTTVYAVKLGLESSDGKLKPGMPADVHFR